jgi:hypothetical protein
MIQPELFKTVAGNYKIAGRNAVTDTTLLQIARDYETAATHKIITIPPGALATRFITDAPVMATTKYDGEGVFIYFEQNPKPSPEKPEIFAFNAFSGRVRTGFPALDSLSEKLKNTGAAKCLLRTELYLSGTGANGRRHNNSDVLHVSFNGTTDEVGRLKLAVIDLIMLNGENWQTKNFQERWEKTGQLAGDDPASPCHRVQGTQIQENQLSNLFKKLVLTDGQEGIVIQRLSHREAFKVKPQITIDAVIIGFVEGESEGRHLVRSLLTALTYPEDGDKPAHFQVSARVFSKLDDDTAEKLLPRLQALQTPEPGNAAGGPFLMTDSDNRPIHFIKPQIIIQIEADEIVPVKKEHLNTSQLMKFENGVWKFLKLTRCPRLSFATFGGLREDKTLRDGGARITQINPAAMLDAAIGDTPKPVIISRQVWTKTGKNGTAVKKITVTDNGSRPNVFRHSILLTDYSPGRAQPFDPTAKFARTKERMEQIVSNLITENIKKGWMPLNT